LALLFSLFHSRLTDNEVRAFRRWSLSTPIDKMPHPGNWPPPRSSSGAFDSNVPWAKYRHQARDETMVYPSHHGKNGGELLDKVKELCQGDLTESELLELDAAFAEQQRMRDEAAAGDENETENERVKLRRESESGGESNEPEEPWRRRVRDFLRDRHQALQSLHTAIMSQGLRWVVDIDIVKYFDSISHSQLRDILDALAKTISAKCFADTIACHATPHRAAWVGGSARRHRWQVTRVWGFPTFPASRWKRPRAIAPHPASHPGSLSWGELDQLHPEIARIRMA
jgi:hypothetical protein